MRGILELGTLLDYFFAIFLIDICVWDGIWSSTLLQELSRAQSDAMDQYFTVKNNDSFGQ